MLISEEILISFAEKCEELYEHIVVRELPNDLPFQGFLSGGVSFGIDQYGYRKIYISILRMIYQFPILSEKWSEEGIETIVLELVRDLAQQKYEGSSKVDFLAMSRLLFTKINIDFEDYTCYLFVSGFMVDLPLEIGDVIFQPIDVNDKIFQSSSGRRFIKQGNQGRFCIASSVICSEPKRAAEILRARVQYALNILRFLAACIWHDRPQRQIFLASRYPSLGSEAFVINSNSIPVFEFSDPEFSIIPIRFTDETHQYADSYGLSYIQSLLRDGQLSELQQSYLTAIQWFGEATQELVPLNAFVQYFIAIEAALKKEKENGKEVIPGRIAVIISPWDKEGQETLAVSIKDLYDERNSVFHSGKPRNSSPERLIWEARILSRQVLHQLRLLIEVEELKTKDDLIDWIEKQTSKLDALLSPSED